MPWAPLLTPEEQARGVTYLGSGSRMRRVAGKLLAGQPVTVVALGGSVTYGHGVDDASQAYPALFFAFLNASFPNRRERRQCLRQGAVCRQRAPPCIVLQRTSGREGCWLDWCSVPWPDCREHVLLNRGLPGATSQVTAPCVHSMVPPVRLPLGDSCN